MAKFEKRIEARKLRREGMSIKSIAEKVGVSKSSSSIWCSDIVLTQKQKDRLYRNMVMKGHKGRVRGAEMNKRKKEERVKNAREMAANKIRNLSKRDLLIAGIALHWGEGTKGSRLIFSNSDPTMVAFIMKWLEDVMNVERQDIIVRVLINEIHRPRIKKVLRFWHSLLNLPPEQFRSTTFIKVKPKKVYENYDNYYGTVKLSVRRSSDLQYYVLGLIEAIKKQAGVA